MNQSVIVFADSAARTTAIPSPVTGMLTYLEDTNAYESWNGSAFVALAEEPDLTSLIPKSTVTTAQDLIVADGASSVTRLGVGTDDQVLSVVAGAVAWSDASGGSLEWTSIYNSTIPTGGAIGTITGLSGYDNYAIRLNQVSGTLGGSYEFKLLINGDDSGTGSHWKVSPGFSRLFAGSTMPLGVFATAGDAVSAFISIKGASSTSVAEVNYVSGSDKNSSGDAQYVGGSMANKDSVALTSIGFEVNGGTVDAGSVTIWGA
jgi:hypothetical protein